MWHRRAMDYEAVTEKQLAPTNDGMITRHSFVRIIGGGAEVISPEAIPPIYSMLGAEAARRDGGTV